MFFSDIVEWHLLGANEISAPDLVWLEAGLARDRVEQNFERKAYTGARHPAIREDRTLVGGDGESPAAIEWKIIRSRQNAGDLRCLQTGRERIGRIGAGIDRGLTVDAQKAPVAVGVTCDDIMMLAAICARGEMFTAVLDPTHRMAAAQGKPTQRYLFGQQNSLIAKAAADVRRNDPDFALIKPEAFSKSGSNDMRHLAGGIERQLPKPRIPVRHHPTAFQRGHGLAGGAKFARNLDGRAERFGDVDVDKRFQENIVAPMLMQQRGSGLTRLQHIVGRG